MSRFLTRPLFFILLLASCQEPEISQIRNEKLPKISYTSLDREPKLKQAIEQVGISNKQMSFGRLKSGISKIKTDSILRVLQADSLNYTYTISIDEEPNPRIFKNLVFQRVKNGFYAFVLEYVSDKPVADFDSFTGVVNKYDLDGNPLQSVTLNKAKENSSGRTMDCSGTWSVACVELIFDGWDSSQYGVELWKCLRYEFILTIDCWNPSGGEEYTPTTGEYGTYIPDPYAGGGSGSGGSGGTTGSTSDPNSLEPSFEGSDPIGVLPPPIDSYSSMLNTLYDIKTDPSLENNQKAKCVYDKLNGNNVFKELIHEFDNNGGSLNLTFKVAELPKPETDGITTTAAPFKEVVITLDKTNLSLDRNVEVAGTFLHEAVHARIFAEMNKAGLAEPSQATSENFPDLFDAYVVFKNGGIPEDQVQHQLMASRYIALIAAGIREFDTRNHNNPEITMEHYYALAWDGLRKTKAWLGLTEEQRQKIVIDKEYILLNCGCTVLNCN